MGMRVLNRCVFLTLLLAFMSVALMPANNAYGQQAEQEQQDNDSTPVVKKKKKPTLEMARSDDILLMVWSSKVAIDSYFDVCLSYAPGAVDDVVKMKSKWNRRNKKVVSSLDGYMQNHLKLTVSDLAAGETIESRLAQLEEEKSAKIRDSIIRSPETQNQVCGDLDDTVGSATRDFLDLYKQNRKTIRQSYK